MALPNYIFRSSSSTNDLLPPDNFDTQSELICRENGGVALSDSSQGISGFVWESSYAPSTGAITLRNLTTQINYPVISGLMNLTSISFAFDSNMRPAIAYTNSIGEAKFRWYDTVPQDYTTTDLPAGAISPKLTHDDKRPFATISNLSDILLFYSLDGVIWSRTQRERFATDHKIATCTPGTRIKRLGMNTKLRIKIEIRGGSFISSP